ncbi:LysR family transcriptional regulator [Marinomonas sp. M1K-6]|uniref:LysR family transcriptional regulator n=1 Tax=Marinomonas profundi TaxID=2726122 RepID=A0A847QWU9_9GAMM|nr:LysR family transcriptional regulator [Marinomonas profundi]NLQ17948.1 LysR family transcriptional regulator [Marinomonas profundi]UDV01675.1 LysR family transcriptional regulator [Marinomonas profundi]
MNINKLRIFHEVFVTGSITRAAERSYVSQPAASKMLTNFEDEIGYKLFVRNNGKLIPTDEALYLHEEVYGLLQGVNHLEDSIKSAKNSKTGRLRIATIFGPSYQFLPELIAEYMKTHPGVDVSLHLSGCSAIRQGIASGQYQIGLVDKAQSSSKHDSVAFDLACYCAVPKDHPAAQLDIIHPHDLHGINWITLDSENATTKALKRLYVENGLPFNRSLEVHTTIHGLSFVNLGMGATLVDILNFRYFDKVFQLPNVVIKPFAPNIVEPLEVLTSNLSPLSGLAKDFYDALIAKLERQTQLPSDANHASRR